MWTTRAGASPCRRPRTPQREPETAAPPFSAWGGDASQGSASRRTIHPDWRDEPAVRDVGVHGAGLGGAALGRLGSWHLLDVDRPRRTRLDCLVWLLMDSDPTADHTAKTPMGVRR
jgi:hypothetical protein